MLIKKKSFTDLLKIDEFDKKIISMIENNPEVTHSEIAKEIDKSQPAVGARIQKLKKKNLLKRLVGLNIKEVSITVAIVFISTYDTELFFKRIKQYSCINYIFKITGNFNIVCIIGAPNELMVNNLIERIFSRDPNIKKVKVEFIIESLGDFIVPIDYNFGRKI